MHARDGGMLQIRGREADGGQLLERQRANVPVVRQRLALHEEAAGIDAFHRGP